MFSHLLRGREERISAINAAKQAKKEELKKSIQQKQQDTARRHEENIEHIRQKAIELSVPRTSEDTAIRMCTLCKVVVSWPPFFFKALLRTFLMGLLNYD